MMTGHMADSDEPRLKYQRRSLDHSQLTETVSIVTETVRKKKLLKKAPEAPRRFKSAYIFFVMEKIDDVKRSAPPEAKVSDVMRTLSTLWKSSSPIERRKFECEAEADKSRYLDEMSRYCGPMHIPNKRLKKPPGAPKRAMSAFLSFSQTMRPLMKTQYPSLTNTEISGVLADQWKVASDAVKRPHIEREVKDRMKYHENMANWKKHESQLISPNVSFKNSTNDDTFTDLYRNITNSFEEVSQPPNIPSRNYSHSSDFNSMISQMNHETLTNDQVDSMDGEITFEMEEMMANEDQTGAMGAKICDKYHSNFFDSKYAQSHCHVNSRELSRSLRTNNREIFSIDHDFNSRDCLSRGHLNDEMSRKVDRTDVAQMNFFSFNRPSAHSMDPQKFAMTSQSHEEFAVDCCHRRMLFDDTFDEKLASRANATSKHGRYELQQVADPMDSIIQKANDRNRAKAIVDSPLPPGTQMNVIIQNSSSAESDYSKAVKLLRAVRKSRMLGNPEDSDSTDD